MSKVSNKPRLPEAGSYDDFKAAVLATLPACKDYVLRRLTQAGITKVEDCTVNLEPPAQALCFSYYTPEQRKRVKEILKDCLLSVKPMPYGAALNLRIRW
jgi:hypothetical protein